MYIVTFKYKPDTVLYEMYGEGPFEAVFETKDEATAHVAFLGVKMVDNVKIKTKKEKS